MPVPSSEKSVTQGAVTGLLAHFVCLSGRSRVRALISALLVIPGWIPTLSRPVRRELTEVILQTVLVVYSVIVIVAFCRRTQPGVAAGTVVREAHGPAGKSPGCSLASMSCLVGVFFLEIAASAWHAWMHRFPRLPTDFVASPPDEYRIVVLGGSSAAGEPYWPWLSVGQIVAWKLSEAVADRRFPCEILAYPGDSLEMQHHKLAALTHRPDAVIIYAGHNEFVARFEEEREGWLDGANGLGDRATEPKRNRDVVVLLVWPTRSSARTGSIARRRLPSGTRSSTPRVCSHVELAEHSRRFPPPARGDRLLLRPDRRLADPDHSARQ